MRAASQLPGMGPLMWIMHLHVNQKSDYDDMTINCSKAVLLLWNLSVFVLSCVCYVFVRVCLYVLVVTCWERAGLLALICGV